MEINREEIKAIAWKQIGESGAAALSLRAIAREMDLTASALYRYFASRDELVTALISGAHTSLSASLITARDEHAQSDTARRIRAMCQAYTHWAAANPQRYLLVFSAPIPGYRIGAEAGHAADRSFLVLLWVIREAEESGSLRPGLVGGELQGRLGEQLAAFQERERSGSPRATYLALAAWSLLHGVTSLLVSGQYSLLLGERGEDFVEREIEKIVSWIA